MAAANLFAEDNSADRGSGGCVCSFEEFIDASGSSARARQTVLSVAGFLFEKHSSSRLQEAWADILTDPRYPIETDDRRFFHMAPFVAHAEPYSRLNDGEWRSLRYRLIDAAACAVEAAAVCSVVLSEYEQALRDEDSLELLGGPLGMCVVWVMDALSDHLEARHPRAKVEYFIEAGDARQHETKKRLDEICNSEFLKRRFRYAIHRFVKKECHHGLGAADMLAWEYRHAIEEHLETGVTVSECPFFHQLFSGPTVAAQHFSLRAVKWRSMAEATTRAKRWAYERDEAR